MTKKDFFRIIIKLFGLYALTLMIFGVIPNNIAYLGYDWDWPSMIWIFLLFLIPVAVYVFLLLKTDLIIKTLRLDRGFDDERIELGRFNPKSLAMLAIVLLGGYLFVTHIPDFLFYCYLAFKKEVSANGLNQFEGQWMDQPMDYYWWAMSFLNLLLGYLLLTNYAKVASWLTRKYEKANSI